MKILRFCTLFLSLFLFANTFAEAGNESYSSFSSSLTPQELNWLEKDLTLTYVYDPDWAPFEWKNDIAMHTGIIADIMHIMKNKTGVNLVATNTGTWAESVDLVKSGKADMFSAITQTNERESYLNFTSKDICSYPAVLVTQFHDKTVYLDIEKDFKNKKIGIVASSGLGRYIKNKYPGLHFVELTSTKEGFHSLRSNTIDMFAINTITAKYFIEKQGFSDLKIATKLDYIYHLKIAINKTLPTEFISIFDKALNSIQEDEFNAIFNKWTEIVIEKQTNWTLVVQIASAFLLVVLFFLWNTKRLKLMVARRTKDLTQKNIELNNALNEIKTLQGIIPICATCKKIRDDQGYWNQLESYIGEHSDAVFSHSVCPECAHRLYPSFYDEKDTINK